jgi:glycine betaine/choline ABC-type transport system substrate-binding protein
MARTARLLLVIIAVLVVLAAGCSSKPRVVVASKNFSEQLLLGEIIAQHIERRLGLSVERKLNLGGTLLAHEALRGGSVDLYPEYTGTALTAVLKQPASRDAKAVLASVREGYRPWKLTWLEPLGFDNTFAMVIRSDTAKQQNLRSLSDAARRSGPWQLGVGYEFIRRPDGLHGLLQTYGLRLRGDPTTMDLGLLYPALQAGQIDMAAANATDGRLAQSDFAVLADDRRYFPPYQCAIVVRDETLARHASLRDALQELSGRITDAQMRRMNAAIDIQHRNVTEVAREFLTGAGGG